MARQAVAVGSDASSVADSLAAQLAGKGLRIAIVFADHRLDPTTIQRTLRAALAPAHIVSGTGLGVIGRDAPYAVGPQSTPAAVALGLYGDWLRVGVGVARDLSHSALTRSRDAVTQARAMLGLADDQLDPSRHVGLTIVDGACHEEESFCIGSAAAAPGARFVGGSASIDPQLMRSGPVVGLNGEVIRDGGVVVLLESALPFETLRSLHLTPTALKMVVTAGSGRTIEQLDGQPAVSRLRALLAPLCITLEPGHRPHIALARYIDGVPYARSITSLADEHLNLAASVDVGHVLRVMVPGDLIGQTHRDLAAAVERVGGQVAALLAFSCVSRHWEARDDQREAALAAEYAAYPVTGFQTSGEQSGMLLVNHTLTGLVIGT